MSTVIKRPPNYFKPLLDKLAQPGLETSVPVARLRGGVAGALEGLLSLFPSDPQDALSPSPMMAAGKQAAKGLVKGIQGFSLPEGKAVRPDAEGVFRVLEGDQALQSLKQMETKPTHRINRESGFVPTVASTKELSDVAVPIADSLDTDMAPSAPIIADTRKNFGREAAIKKSKLTADVIYKIRELHDRGWSTKDIVDLTKVPKSTVYEIKNRLSYGWIPEKPTSK